jgi:signal transduction histidine kinase
MDRLVQDLLDISRIEAGQMRLQMGQVIPEVIVNEAVEGYEPAIQEKGQNLSVEIQPNLPLIIGDKGRLIQVLTNLISNAHKYTPEGGDISIQVSAKGERDRQYVSWRVADSGIGLSKDELDKLFTKYFRADRSIVQNNPGTGLGLAISQHIIELHGGTISVESVNHQGSTFSFTVPII